MITNIIIKVKKSLKIIGILLITNFALFGAENNDIAKTIYLCSENHNNKDDARFKEDVLRLANNKAFIYASEAVTRDPEDEYKFMEYGGYKQGIYGIEDPLVLAFTHAIAIAAEREGFESANPNEIDFLSLLFLQSNQKFLNEFFGKKELLKNPIFKFLKAQKGKLNKETKQFQQNEFIKKMRKYKNKDWIDFARQFALTLESTIAGKIRSDKLETLEFLMTCCTEGWKLERFSNLIEAQDFLAFFQAKLYSGLRNDFIIANLETIYSIAKKENLALVCILGSSHLKEVKKGLEDKGFTVLGKKEFLKTLVKSEL